MTRQIVVIHGGTTFYKYEDYLTYLKTKEVSVERLTQVDWKSSLAKELGSKFQVILPKMPNPTDARYDEWKIWFGRISGLFNDNVILIGHSLGGIFLAKFLSENKFPVKIKATMLVSAPFDEESEGESLTGFKLPMSLENFQEQGGKIILFHSEDDPVVSINELGKYKSNLPNAEAIILNDRKHFNQKEFPELIAAITRNLI